MASAAPAGPTAAADVPPTEYAAPAGRAAAADVPPTESAATAGPAAAEAAFPASVASSGGSSSQGFGSAADDRRVLGAVDGHGRLHQAARLAAAHAGVLQGAHHATHRRHRVDVARQTRGEHVADPVTDRGQV